MYIRLELLSDTCIGSGESVAGIIDTEIQFDSLGIPFIPSKRLKGILREAAEDYALLDGRYSTEVENLFGKKGNNTFGKLIISNGFIEDYKKVKEVIKRGQNTEDIKSLFYEDNIKENYTYVRTQTAIDSKTGIAKNNSLRNIRVIKKGLVFTFEINEIDNNELELLKGACAFAKHIGLNRTRGYGSINITIIEESKDSKKETKNEIINITNKINYKITFKSPVILQDDYISGSTLLGLVAAKYIKKNNLSQDKINNDEKFKKLFLNDEVVYSNGYVSVNNIKNYPTPITFLKVKGKETDELINIANIEGELNKEERYVAIPYKYGDINENIFEGYNVKKEVNYHHRRAEDKTIGRAKEGDGQYFSYEAIVAGTEFIGEIIGNEDSLKDIIELFKDDNNIYIGASRSTQYGKSTIEFFEENTVENNYKDINAILFTSPMIIRNDYGVISTDKLDLMLELGLEVDDIVSMFIKTTEIGGFNTKWGLPKERTIAIKEGSVIVLKNKEKLVELINKSHGERIAEGYGRLTVIKTDIKENVDLTYKAIDKEEIIKYIDVDEFSNKFIKEKTFELFDNIIRKKISSLVDCESHAKSFIEYMSNQNISNSVIANIQRYLNKSNSFEKFDSELESAKKRAAKNQTEKNIYESISKDYLQENNRSYEKFNEIIKDDFKNIRDKSNISELFKSEYATVYLDECDRFNLYKEYMGYLLKIMKYKRRKIHAEAKEVINSEQ